MLQTLVHYGCHLFIPLLVAYVFFTSHWKTAFIIMLSGLWIDIDHVLATPIFNPDRCSINFHPLHTYYALLIYLLLCLPKKTRLFGLGLVIHLISDTVDCAMM
ncbi:hypothetical protein KFZ70_08930 [Tamlana fucoidanivorans]|uniref:Metal-dependent hydrolase n=1 Tax=Allotamlana fucoidanivorans TaxID=2583814 RepID=A0A5C4SPC2_9FLAO|nr:DUF6122 family protein [Tamlana fucoidanivorans]TNJ46114.1 hypothetical protein FGF67_03750 [Tamlana fucoidanivorans]